MIYLIDLDGIQLEKVTYWEARCTKCSTSSWTWSEHHSVDRRCHNCGIVVVYKLRQYVNKRGYMNQLEVTE